MTATSLQKQLLIYVSLNCTCQKLQLLGSLLLSHGRGRTEAVENFANKTYYRWIIKKQLFTYESTNSPKSK